MNRREMLGATLAGMGIGLAPEEVTTKTRALIFKLNSDYDDTDDPALQAMWKRIRAKLDQQGLKDIALLLVGNSVTIEQVH